MKAPAGRPGLDVRLGRELAAARGPKRWGALRPAAATCPPPRGLRGRGRSKGRRAAGRAPLAGGARAGGRGLHRLQLLINRWKRALPAPDGDGDDDGKGGLARAAGSGCGVLEGRGGC